MKTQGGCGTWTSDGLTQCAALRKGLVANTAVHQEHETDLRQTGRHKGTAGHIWVSQSPGTDMIPCVRSQREFVPLMHLCHRILSVSGNSACRERLIERKKEN